MNKSIQAINLLVLLVLAVLVYFNTVDIEDMQPRLKVAETRIDDIKFHSKIPCMTLPLGSPCTRKTMHIELPGGSMKKAIVQYCWWESEGIAQEWLK